MNAATRYNIRGKKISDLKLRADIFNKRTASLENDLVEVLSILEDAVLLANIPTEVEGVLEWVRLQPFFRETSGRDILNLHKHERNIRGLTKVIDLFVKYYFAFDHGATMSTRTIYANTHAEAWKKANLMVEDEFSGRIRCIFCYRVGDTDPGTLNNMHSLFTERIEGQFNGVKAHQLLPKWQEYEYGEVHAI